MRKFLISAAFVLPLIVMLTSCDPQVDVKPFKFAYFQDTHISDVAANVEDLEVSVADVIAQDDIDFVIFGGDITEFGSDEEIYRAKEIMDRLDIPYYILSGNHDSKWSESGCNTFREAFGYEVFEFDFNGVHFMGTNSGPNMRMMPALVPREAMVWLDSMTNSLPARKPVVFINHYPLDDAMLNSGEVIDLLKRTNIQLSMCGHGHNNREMDFSGVRGVMGRSNLRAGKGAAGYNIVTVAGDSLVMAERRGGETLEPWFKIDLLKRSENPAVQGVSADEADGDGSDGSDGDEAVAVGGAVIGAAVVGADGEPIASGASPVTVVWEVQDNSDIGSAPASAFGMVYTSNTAGFVKAYDLESGSELWSYATDGKLFSTPAVDEKSGVLVVGSTDNFIYGLDARSGEFVWKVEAGRSVLGSPAIYDGVAYIGASDGVFRAISAADGEVVWEYTDIKGFIESKPWVDEEGVYVGDWANRVYAFDPEDGDLQWEWTNKKGRGLSAAAVWPVKANGKVFVVTPQRRVHALDASNGRELWATRGGREAIGLSEDGSRVYIKNMRDTVIAFSTDEYKRVAGYPGSGPVDEYRYDPESGSGAASGGSFSLFSPPPGNWPGRRGEPVVVWESHTGYGYEIAPSPIVENDGVVYIPTDKGNIFALDAETGKVLWTYRFSIALINYILPMEDNRMLVTSMDGKVALLNVL